MKVLIAGANGKVGTLLCGQMWAANGFSPVALIRDARQQTKFTALGVPSVVGDLEKGLTEFLPGLDAVVFTAGSGAHTGPDKTIDADQDAAIRLIDDCRQVGVPRFVMISAIGADPSSDSPRIRNYLRAKGVADEYLRASGLDFTILAPGTLTNEGGTGKISAAEHSGLSRDFAKGRLVAMHNRGHTQLQYDEKDHSDDFRQRSDQESSCKGFGRGCSSAHSLTFLQIFQLRLVGERFAC